MQDRLAKNLIAGLSMLVLLASFPAAAQQGGKRMGPGGQGRQAPPRQVPASEVVPHHRDAHVEDRMTPEQRRQLRRDVHNHGRDIYRERAGAKQP